MHRYRLAVAYNGGMFHGAQVQRQKVAGKLVEAQRTIAGEIENALGKLVGVSNVGEVYFSSRTDTGVHAVRNTCHVDIRRRPARRRRDQMTGETLAQNTERHLDLPATIPFQPAVLGRALNHFLHQQVGNRIRCMGAEAVDFDWHARFSAKRRIYQYVILHQDKPCFHLCDKVWARNFGSSLDVGEMRKAMKHLEGNHDFKMFHKSRRGDDTYSTMRTLDSASLSEINLGGEEAMLGLASSSDHDVSQQLVLTFAARSFLHMQVRKMVGFLCDVGRRRRSAEDVLELLACNDSVQYPRVAPPHGLYLMNVEY